MASPPISLSFLLFLLSVLLSNTTLSTASSPAAASAVSKEFLRARCSSTLYPSVCYDALLPYAGSFQTSHAKLAHAGTDVASAQLRTFSTHLADLCRGASKGDAAAVKDCASTVSSAADLAKKSSAELGGLEGTEAASGRRWKLSNAKTWLSAALTNVVSCVDGLGEASGTSAVRKEVAGKATTVKQYTSNALALVNGIPL